MRSTIYIQLGTHLSDRKLVQRCNKIKYRICNENVFNISVTFKRLCESFEVLFVAVVIVLVIVIIRTLT